MSITNLSTFQSELLAEADLVDLNGTDLLREIAQTTAEAVVLGNEFGPGVPLDTGWTRASFRVGLNAPEDGPSEPPPNDPTTNYPPPDLSDTARAQLGDAVYITTSAKHAEFLENLPLVRRNGPPENIGAPTMFVAPVAERFDQIVDDVAERVWYPNG